MTGRIREDADRIIRKTVDDVLPDRVVKETLKNMGISGRIYVAAIGKAAWTMGKAAADCLGDQIAEGIIVTKYGHSRGSLPGFEIIESGHPVPDENSVIAAKKVMALTDRAGNADTVLFLLSGGGSALVELPSAGLSLKDIRQITEQLLRCGARITEINILRKKLSAVKGGKLAQRLGNKKACSIVLSDVIGNHEDMIASGLTYPDESTAADAWQIVTKYGLQLDPMVRQALYHSRPCKEVYVENHVVGSVENLCNAAAAHARECGYHSHILTASWQCEAKEAGKQIVSEAERGQYERPFALIAGGETVVRVTGKGMGGRNQELALSAAEKMAGKEDMLLFSLGSDGSDGPTDAAGGIVDGDTAGKLENMGIRIRKVLQENDSYHALKDVDGLIMTGATGTNVNDVTVLLCR